MLATKYHFLLKKLLISLPVSSSAKKAVVPQTTLNMQISITRLDFVGDEMPGCFHGGLAVFEITATNLVLQKKLLCTSKYANAANVQNIYSNKKKLLVVGYAYRHYSSINVSVTITQSPCNVVTIHTCKYIQQNTADANPCDLSDPIIQGVVCLRVNYSMCTTVQIITDIFLPSKLWLECKVSFIFYAAISELRTHKLVFSGYFPAHIEFSSERERQYFRIGGVDFVHNEKEDFKLSKWKDKQEWELTPDEYQYVYQEGQLGYFEKATSLQLAMNIRNTGNEAINYQVNMSSSMPRSSKSLVFTFNGYPRFSWLDIMFLPCSEQSGSSIFHSHVGIVLNHDPVKLRSEEDHILVLTVHNQTTHSPTLQHDPTLQLEVHTKVKTVPLLPSKLSSIDYSIVIPCVRVHVGNLIESTHSQRNTTS